MRYIGPNEARKIELRMLACRKDAKLVQKLLEMGDNRLLAMDGPISPTDRPDLSAQEWGRVYRACKRISKRLA